MIIPVWFGGGSKGIVVIPDIEGAGTIPPPSDDFPKLDIGPDGRATKAPDSGTESSKPTESSESATSSDSSSEQSSSASSTTQSSSSSSSSSSIETSSPTSYVMVANANSSSADRKPFDSKLREYATTGVASSVDGDGNSTWAAPLNSKAVNDLNSSSVIKGIVPDQSITIDCDDAVGSNSSSSCKRQIGGITARDTDPPELALISSLQLGSTTYNYDPRA